MRALLTSLRQFLSGSRSRAGNVAVIFGIAIVPIIGAVGAAVDYSTANSNRTSMQKALDSTALALAKLMPLSQAELNTKGWQLFSASIGHVNVNLPQANLVITTPTVGKIHLEATGHYTPQISGVIGIQTFPIRTRTEVQWGMKKLELALVLDVTGSMAEQNRMVELKKATKSLLTTLKNAAKQPDDVKISLIPFAGQVNINKNNVNASWLDWSEWEAQPAVMANWINNNKTTWEQTGPGSSCPFTNNAHGFRCSAGPASTSNDSVVNNVPSSGTNKGLICPSKHATASVNIGRYYNGCYNSTEKTRQISSGSNASCGNTVNCSCSGSGSNRKCTQTYYEHSWVKNARSTWDGCVRDRQQNHDVADTLPTSTATYFQPFQNFYCPPSLLALTNDWTALNNKVDDLDSLGATNITIGLIWGLHSLTTTLPLTEANTTEPQLTRAIILMTDGDNTINRWNGVGTDPNQCTGCDARTTLACNSVKASGIRLYTVRLIDGNATLLRNCASDPSMYFEVQTASQLNAVFNAIGGELASLHLSQ